MQYYRAFCIIEKIFFGGYNIRMLKITIDNCYKCDLEKINDKIIVNIFGLIEEILKLKLNVTGKHF